MADTNQEAGVGPIIQKWGPWIVAVIISIAMSVINKTPQPLPPLPMQPSPVIVNCPAPAAVVPPAAAK